MEFWDLLDRQGKKTGKTFVRGHRSLRRNEYHLVVHIWVLNSKNEYLIQRRSDKKPLMPGEWAATGGSALAGETARQAACRELSEELGITVRPKSFRYLKRFWRKNSLNDVFSVRVDVDEKALCLQKDEVAEVKWVTADELRRMVERGEFHNYGEEYFRLIFSLSE